MPSFDVVSKTDLAEVDNAVNGILREVGQRYDLKGTMCNVEQSDGILTVTDDDMRLRQLHELIHTYWARRGIDSRGLEFKTPESATKGSLRQQVTIKQGVDGDLGRRIVKVVKAAKTKVQVAIQGDEPHVSSKKRDDLQEAIAVIKEMGIEQPLQYVNFRE